MLAVASVLQRIEAAHQSPQQKGRMMWGNQMSLVTTKTKSLFSWKYAGILVGMKLGIVAVVLGLSRVGLVPEWFLHWG